MNKEQKKQSGSEITEAIRSALEHAYEERVGIDESDYTRRLMAYHQLPDELKHKFILWVYKVARWYAMTDDVAHEFIASLLTREGSMYSLALAANPKGYIKTAIKRQAWRSLRVEPVQTSESLEETPDLSQNPESVLVAREQLSQTIRAIEDFSPPLQKAFNRKLQEELGIDSSRPPVEERSSYYARWSRAKRKIREHLANPKQEARLSPKGCRYCGSRHGVIYTPLDPQDKRTLVPVCTSCDESKGTESIQRWLQSLREDDIFRWLKIRLHSRRKGIPLAGHVRLESDE